MNGFGAHLGFEFIAPLFDRVQILLIGQKLTSLQRGQPRIQDDIGLKIQNPLDVPQGHVQHQADPRGQRFQEPDMRHRAGQLDVRHALAANLGQRDLGTAFFTNHTTMLHALVLAAEALVVLHRPEDGGAEQAVTFRLEGPVINRFRLLHLAE